MAEHNWNHIRTVLQDQGFHCQLTDHSEDMGMISIQGPKRWGKKGGGDLYLQVRKGQNKGDERRRGEEQKEVTDWSEDRL